MPRSNTLPNGCLRCSSPMQLSDELAGRKSHANTVDAEVIACDQHIGALCSCRRIGRFDSANPVHDGLDVHRPLGHDPVRLSSRRRRVHDFRCSLAARNLGIVSRMATCSSSLARVRAVAARVSRVNITRRKEFQHRHRLTLTRWRLLFLPGTNESPLSSFVKRTIKPEAANCQPALTCAYGSHRNAGY